MKTVIIDSKAFKDKEGFHELLKLKLDLPEYYGKNLDALWDCLTGDIELPIRIIWENFDSSRGILGEYADKAAELFKKAQNYSNQELIFELH